MRRLYAVLVLAVAPACSPVEYTIGSASASAGGTCPQGQVVCGEECAAPDACDDCPQGQVKCGLVCVEAGGCDDDEDCPHGQVACDDACVAADTCPCEHGCDPEREVCDGGVCRCRDGLTRCASDCADPRADPLHCGACGQDCPGDSVCDAGACAAGCDPSRDACDGACVDLASDPLHCHECEQACPAGELCLSGECRGYSLIPDCASCPCPDACEEFDTDSDTGDAGEGCCDSPFLDAAVCVEGDCS